MLEDTFAHDRFLVDQLIRPVVNLYRITPLAAGETPAGSPIAFVRQKALKIKEEVRFFRDESESEELFRIRARQALDISGRYDVTTPDGERIGVLHKAFGRSLLRSTWTVLDAAEAEVAQAQEANLLVAVLRRLPYLDQLPIPYNFTISAGGRQIGSLSRIFTLRDRYVLDLSGDPERSFDRRVALALAVGLDTLQHR